jgi:hypothetical protein
MCREERERKKTQSTCFDFLVVTRRSIRERRSIPKRIYVITSEGEINRIVIGEGEMKQIIITHYK